MKLLETFWFEKAITQGPFYSCFGTFGRITWSFLTNCIQFPSFSFFKFLWISALFFAQKLRFKVLLFFLQKAVAKTIRVQLVAVIEQFITVHPIYFVFLFCWGFFVQIQEQCQQFLPLNDWFVCMIHQMIDCLNDWLIYGHKQIKKVQKIVICENSNKDFQHGPKML